MFEDKKNKQKDKKLPTEPYKGVRDFYPEDMFIRKYIFGQMREVVEKYGYAEYDASILEPADLYRAKTGDEIVNEQTYSFTDRGDREVTLRPEMTPTVARMVAGRSRELTFPLRWYSIPNVFRYERPQRGRLREHWQLNVDLFGVSDVEAEIELISIAQDLMFNFGATEDDFIIRINNRKLITAILKDFFAIEEDKIKSLIKLIDKKNKIDSREFKKQLTDLAVGHSKELLEILECKTLGECVGKVSIRMEDSADVKNLEKTLVALEKSGVTTAVFDPSLVRGFDYYDGTVFEVFDTNKKNKRSLFGGGRFDGLMEIFGVDPIPAVGFGMGDVTIKDFLETRNLLPDFKSTAQVYICTTDTDKIQTARELASSLRSGGINVEVNLSSKRVGEQIRTANKKTVPFIICLGDEEIESETYKIKNLATSEEKKLRLQELVKFILEHEEKNNV